MRPALLDTDTVSYYFRNLPTVVDKVDTYLREFGFIHISIVTYYEVMNGLLYKDAKSQLSRFEKFISLNSVLPLSVSIAKNAADVYASLRKQGVNIGHNDVMIASTAIMNELTLVTNNSRHFSHIANLEVDNWAKV